MSPLKSAIQSSLKYAKFFDYDLTPTELHLWLCSSKQHSSAALKKCLSTNSFLKAKVHPTMTQRRLRSLSLTQKKLTHLHSVLPYLSLLPTIKFIALTGSLAMDNAKPNDDIDIMIVTSTNTLWLTRPLVFLLLKALRLRRPITATQTHQVNNKICDNLWLDQSALKVPIVKRSLYTAHEVLQVKPILNRGATYQSFITQNSWVKKYLANAYKGITTSFSSSQKSNISKQGRGSIPLLNRLAFHLQYLYMKRKLTSEYVTPHSAYFHPRDLSKELTKAL